ncbi:cDNA sequence BC031181, isoform CRA_b, partial [Mus musculus]
YEQIEGPCEQTLRTEPLALRVLSYEFAVLTSVGSYTLSGMSLSGKQCRPRWDAMRRCDHCRRSGEWTAGRDQLQGSWRRKDGSFLEKCNLDIVVNPTTPDSLCF